MTVGVAAIAEQKYIVTASDRALTVEIVSDDCIFKAEPFHYEWSAILSGGDITDAVPILKSAEKLFADKDNTLENAIESLSGAFRKHLSNKAGSRVLGRYGITMHEYLEKGLTYFSAEERSFIAQEIQSERLDCCFLASGFDKDGQPHIFKVVEPGMVESYDKPGFWAIGSGETAARTLLLYLGQNNKTSLANSIYNVCAAKFMAEEAAGVGRETWFFLKAHETDVTITPGFFLEEIRQAWENEGRPRVPEVIVSKLQQYISENKLIPVHMATRIMELKEKLAKESSS